MHPPGIEARMCHNRSKPSSKFLCVSWDSHPGQRLGKARY